MTGEKDDTTGEKDEITGEKRHWTGEKDKLMKRKGTTDSTGRYFYTIHRRLYRSNGLYGLLDILKVAMAIVYSAYSKNKFDCLMMLMDIYLLHI